MKLIEYVAENADRLRKLGILHVRDGEQEVWLEPDVTAQLEYLKQLAGEPPPEDPRGVHPIYDPATGARGYARRPEKRQPEDE